MATRFGPSGNSESFYAQGHKHTYEAMEWIANMGLRAYEYSFGRGIRIGQSTAEKIRERAEQYGIAMSVHAPFYINLACADEEKYQKNREYFLQSAQAARLLGASRVIFHPGACTKMDRETAFALARKNMTRILADMEEAGFSDMIFCPETMGKRNQLGNLEEVLILCRDNENLLPAIDFAHLHALSGGGLKGPEDFGKILDAIEEGIGRDRMYKMHIHFSKIEFTAAGEKQHRCFSDEGYGPQFEHLAVELVRRKLCPVVICESKGTMGEDAASMRQTYEIISMKASSSIL